MVAGVGVVGDLVLGGWAGCGKNVKSTGHAAIAATCSESDNAESGAVYGVVLLGGWRAVARTLRGTGNDMGAVHGFVCRVAGGAV